MAYDEVLAERIRELVEGEPGLTEQKMFGGLAFLIGGNMAVAASGQGGVLVRVDPAESAALVAAPVIGERALDVFIDQVGVEGDRRRRPLPGGADDLGAGIGGVARDPDA